MISSGCIPWEVQRLKKDPRFLLDTSNHENIENDLFKDKWLQDMKWIYSYRVLETCMKIQLIQGDLSIKI